MFGLLIFLVAATLAPACLAAGNVFAPPYVQSREAFSHTRTYISEALDPNIVNIYHPETRTHESFGILADVTAAIVLANKTDPRYHPLRVLDKHLPYAWRNYKQIALKGQELLNEASSKIRLIEDLIDNICDAESVEQCNVKIQTKVEANPFAYKMPAELLILLGEISDIVRALESSLNDVTGGRTEIPHLINTVETPQYTLFIHNLKRAYDKMRQLQYRRFMSPVHII